VHTELGVEFGELVQARELAICARSRSHIESHTMLMSRRAAPDHNLLAFLGFLHTRLTSAGAFLSNTNATLFLRCAVCRCDRYLAVDGDERLEKVGGGACEVGCKTVDVLFFVCPTVDGRAARPFAR
jgi:hypothetical protein